MSTANTLAIITILERLLTRAASIGELLRTAHAEGRSVSDEELQQLRDQDDAARLEESQAIADARAREAGRARPGFLAGLALVLGLALVAISPAAQAGQAPNTVTSPQINSPQPRTAVLSWTAPATYTDARRSPRRSATTSTRAHAVARW